MTFSVNANPHIDGFWTYWAPVETVVHNDIDTSILKEVKYANQYVWLKNYVQRKSFGFFIFDGISTFLGYLMPKPFSEKNSSGTI